MFTWCCCYHQTPACSFTRTASDPCPPCEATAGTKAHHPHIPIQAPPRNPSYCEKAPKQLAENKQVNPSMGKCLTSGKVIGKQINFNRAPSSHRPPPPALLLEAAEQRSRVRPPAVPFARDQPPACDCCSCQGNCRVSGRGMEDKEKGGAEIRTEVWFKGLCRGQQWAGKRPLQREGLLSR